MIVAQILMPASTSIRRRFNWLGERISYNPCGVTCVCLCIMRSHTECTLPNLNIRYVLYATSRLCVKTKYFDSLSTLWAKMSGWRTPAGAQTFYISHVHTRTHTHDSAILHFAILPCLASNFAHLAAAAFWLLLQQVVSFGHFNNFAQ